MTTNIINDRAVDICDIVLVHEMYHSYYAAGRLRSLMLADFSQHLNVG